MPMWLRLVPLLQTTAASSSYRGARKAAPASRNEGDDGAGIEKGEVVVGGVEVAQRALHGRVVGHLLRPPPRPACASDRSLGRLTHYEVLGVSTSATGEEIMRAYLRQAHLLH